ncbi:MAG: hypothetical protein ACI3XI_09030 [Eubacteriales bacterium]
MKNYKLIALVIALLMLCECFVFVSCTGTEHGATEAPETTTSPDEETEAPHVHAWGAWETASHPNCTSSGSYERRCACGETETKEIGPTGHIPGAWVIVKEASETSEGSKEQYCRICEEKLQTETIPVSEHVYGEWIIDKEETCTEEGARHRVCTKCGESSPTEVIPAKGHKEIIDRAVQPTCTESGKDEGKHCFICHEVLRAQTEVAAVGHYAGEWVIDKFPTSTEDGIRRKECLSCGEVLKTESIAAFGEAYALTLVDGMGAPTVGVNVKFMSGSEVVFEGKTDEYGSVTANMEAGDYDVVPEAGEGVYLSMPSIRLTSAERSATVTVVEYASKREDVYFDTVNPVYGVSTGAYRVKVKNGERRYLLFYPGEGGHFSLSTDSRDVEIGCYGASYFLLSENIGTIEADGSMSMQVTKSEYKNAMIIGLTAKSESVEECTLIIKKTADIELTPAECPYEVYEPEHVPSYTATPEGKLTYIDISVDMITFEGREEIQVVFNSADGYFHLNTADGPVLYVRISGDTEYLGSLYTIATTTLIGKVFNDENGNFVRKESYNEALQAYGEAADKKYGVVALDKDLIYILKTYGEGGWYERTSVNWLFGDTIVMPYNGWLFACCYFE